MLTTTSPTARTIVTIAHLRMAIWDPNGGLTATAVQDTIDFLTNIAALPPGLKAGDVSDLSYLNAVLDEIRRQ